MITPTHTHTLSLSHMDPLIALDRLSKCLQSFCSKSSTMRDVFKVRTVPGSDDRALINILLSIGYWD